MPIVRNLTLLLALLFAQGIVVAQFGEPQIIYTDLEFPSLAIPGDIDGDGDQDILVSAISACELCWFENLDGQGNFGSPIEIEINSTAFGDIQFVDIDGDNDNDIVYIQNNPSALRWLENIDGQGQYSSPITILEEDFIWQFIFEDLDEDNDLDLVLSTTDTLSERISWFENMDGQGNFGPQQIVFSGLNFFSNISIEDVDNDGLNDILTSDESAGPARFLYYKNLGNQTFGTGTQIFAFDFLLSDTTSVFNIQFKDITNDGIEDIVFISFLDVFGSSLNILPGVNQNGLFGEPSLLLPTGVVPILNDLDNDGDIDIVIAGADYGSILFFEYDEINQSFDFTNPSIVTSEVGTVEDFQIADLNGDGLGDIISASSNESKVAWYTNETLSTPDNTLSTITALPNPVKTMLTINYGHHNLSSTVTNTSGQELNIPIINNQIDFSSLSSGLYFVKLNDPLSGLEKVLKILKN